jgi:hypothetical protein
MQLFRQNTVLGAVIVLTLRHVFATTVSLIAKTVVLAVMGFCLACLFCWHRFTLTALFLMVGLGIYLSIYQICVRARPPRRHD